MTDEIRPALTWTPIRGYEGLYEVSRCGLVRRVAGLDSIGRPRRERILRQTDEGRGYLIVSLSKNDEVRTARVHSLVAEAFLGTRLPGQHVNHIDGVKSHNDASNLEYCTPAENNQHAASLGLSATGERHGSAKLSWAAVQKIREQRAMRTTSNKALAKEYGVSETAIERVLSGRLWANRE